MAHKQSRKSYDKVKQLEATMRRKKSGEEERCQWGDDLFDALQYLLTLLVVLKVQHKTDSMLNSNSEVT